MQISIYAVCKNENAISPVVSNNFKSLRTRQRQGRKLHVQRQCGGWPYKRGPKLITVTFTGLTEQQELALSPTYYYSVDGRERVQLEKKYTGDIQFQHSRSETDHVLCRYRRWIRMETKQRPINFPWYFSAVPPCRRKTARGFPNGQHRDVLFRQHRRKPLL